jgi:hypothetical protein
MAAVPPVEPPVIAPEEEPPVDLLAQVHQAFTVCGIVQDIDRVRIIVFEGINSITFLGNLTDDEIEKMAVRLAKRTPANTRVFLGMGQIKRLKTLAYWIRKMRREGQAIDIDNLDEAQLDSVADEVALTTPTKPDEKLFYPLAFDSTKYVSWSRSFANYLDSRIGKANVSLSYIIRPVDADPEQAVDEYQRVLWMTPHHGPAFEDDNRQVYRIYKDLIVGTDGWAWFSMAPEGNGRAAHRFLQQHYLGDDANARRAVQSKAYLERLHYKNEATFAFKEYVTRLHECFEALEDNNQGLIDAHKVDKLLAGVQSNNVEVMSLKTYIRAQHANDFNAAATHMAKQIVAIYPAAHQQDPRVKRRMAAIDTGARGRGRFGTNNRNGGGRNMINGVDVSNPNRNFTNEEWNKLRDSGMMAWIVARRQNRPRGGRGGNRGGRGGGRGHDARGGGRGDGRNNAGRGEARVAVVRFADDVDEHGAHDQPAQRGGGRGGRNGARFGAGRRQGA